MIREFGRVIDRPGVIAEAIETPLGRSFAKLSVNTIRLTFISISSRRSLLGALMSFELGSCGVAPILLWRS